MAQQTPGAAGAAPVTLPHDGFLAIPPRQARPPDQKARLGKLAMASGPTFVAPDGGRRNVNKGRVATRRVSRPAIAAKRRVAKAAAASRRAPAPRRARAQASKSKTALHAERLKNLRKANKARKAKKASGPATTAGAATP